MPAASVGVGMDPKEVTWEGGKNRTLLMPEYSFCWSGQAARLPTGAVPAATEGDSDGDDADGNDSAFAAAGKQSKGRRNGLKEVKSGRSGFRRGRSDQPRGMALGRSAVGEAATDFAGGGAGAAVGDADIYTVSGSAPFLLTAPVLLHHACPLLCFA